MQYEVEIKSLLGSEENTSMLRSRMQALDPHFAQLSSNKQLNHYFAGGDIQKLLQPFPKLKDIASQGRDFSVRTRDKDGTVFLVAKASTGDDSSSNGVSRMEFEERVPFTLEELDQLLLDAGFNYQAKWSREREEYTCQNIAVCLDKNAGYGWLAEFEKVVDTEQALEQARRDVRALMDACGAQELQQDRLERMFAFYNAHWGEYYGTEKVFTIA